MSPYIYNNPQLKPFRRSLRKNQTDAERKLWQKLRGRQIDGIKFFRQYSVGAYILDFYSPTHFLSIELDGSQHLEKQNYDAQRTVYLRSKGIHELRFWDNEVLNNLAVVMEVICNQLANPSQPPLILRGGAR